jgi:SAM-dependent methyltransferase
MADLPGFFQGTELPDSGWWEALWPEPAKILSRLGLTSGMGAVDLCSGDGWFTLPMAQVARHVTAIDIDGKLLEVARIRLAESGLANCRFIEADAYDVAKVVSIPADFVFLANAFHGVPDKARLSREIRSVLKPSGRLVIVNWHALPRERTPVLGKPRGPATELRMTPEETIAAVEPAGLATVRVIEVPPYHYGAIFENKAI